MSAAPFVLAWHSIKRTRGVLIGVAGVLAAFQFLLTQVAVYLMQNQAFGMLQSLTPEFMRAIAGPSVVAFMSFAGIVSLGYFHPIVLVALLSVAIAGATEPAAEAEVRFVDLTLARPVTRAQLITRTLIVLIVSIAVVVGVMTASTLTGLVCCTPVDAPRPTAATTRSLALTLAVVAWCWGGIALAIASAVKRRATAVGLSAVAALATYLLDYLGRVWDPARGISRLSPFHYFEPMSLVSGGGLNVREIAVLFTIGAAASAVGYVVFARRDL